VHRHYRQPYPRPEFQRHGGHQGQGSLVHRYGARDGTAKAINISSDQRLLLVEAQEFVIDGHEVREPIGMSGIRLEAKIHIVTGAQSAAENIIKCAPLRPGSRAAAAQPAGIGQAVLTDDERELGVAVVDIGAGATDVAIFTGGAIRHTAVIPIAGDLITSDIAMALRTPPRTPRTSRSRAATPSCWPTPMPRSKCRAWATAARA
jgi:cell division protein FtsA